MTKVPHPSYPVPVPLPVPVPESILDLFPPAKY